MRASTLLLPLLLLPAVLVAAGCSRTEAVPQEDACVVGADRISRRAHASVLDEVQRDYRAAGARVPAVGSPEHVQLVDEATRRLVQEQLLQQDAKERGVRVSRRQAERQLEQLNLSRFEGDDAAYRAELRASGLTDEEVVDRVRLRMLEARLYALVTKDVTVSERAVRSAFRRDAAQQRVPERRRVLHIFVTSAPLAQRLARQLDGASVAAFRALGRRVSEDLLIHQSVRGVEIVRGQAPAEYERVAFAASTGRVVGPVRTRIGHYVILPMSDVVPARTLTYQDARASIRSRLLEQANGERLRAWMRDLVRASRDEVRCHSEFLSSRSMLDDGLEVGQADARSSHPLEQEAGQGSAPGVAVPARGE